MRFIHVWVGTMILIAVFASCTLMGQGTPDAGTEGGISAGEGATELISAEVERAAASPLTAAEVEELVAANNAFAADLYRAVAAGNEENVIFSPYSVSLAFSMAYAGARGETEAQMQETLHFLPQEEQHAGFNALEQHLGQLAETAEAGGEGAAAMESGEPFRLRIANAAWGQQGFPFQESYLQTLGRQYGAGLRALDFGADPKAAREAINAWIADATEERIRNMLPPGVISGNTRLVLANAIYFYGAWLFPFNEEATADGPFTLLDGSTVSAPLMHQNTARVPYGDGDGYRAVALPYTGQKAEMLLILPEEGRYAEVEEQLDAAFLESVRSGLETRDVTLTLPRFDFEDDVDLKAQLQGMGMTAPFDSAADFSGLVEGGGLWISDALHKATIAVDEVGTEATAATVIAMEESAMERAEFEATRPFMLAIVERETGTLLFLGRVLNPAQ